MGRQLHQPATRLCLEVSFEGAAPRNRHLFDEDAVFIQRNKKHKNNHNNEDGNHGRDNNSSNGKGQLNPQSSRPEMMLDATEGSPGA